MGARIAHFSTDYVFDGTKSRWFVVEDVVAPLGTYGRSNYGGEEVPRASGVPQIILRVGADQTGEPTSTAHISKVTIALVPGMRTEAAPG